MSEHKETKNGTKSTLKKIEWSDRFLLANTEGLSHEQRFDMRRIDAHHKRLVRIIAKLYEIMQPGQYNPKKIQEVMKDLTDFVVTHLTFEEGLMAYYGYKDLEQHKANHDSIRERVHELIEDANRGAIVYVILYQFLENWLLNHIATSDREFVNTLKKQQEDKQALQGLDPQLLAEMALAGKKKPK